MDTFLQAVGDLLSNLVFLFQRMTWISVLDLLLVTLVFFFLLQLVRDTQAIMLLRGVLAVILAFSLLTSLVQLPAFSWLIRNTLPAILLAIPVIFAPEIRRGLLRLGRGTMLTRAAGMEGTPEVIRALVSATMRLADLKHGALIVLQRSDNLDEYLQTGVPLHATVTPELLLQIFYPNTPLHDGAVIIQGTVLAAAGCVMPLSASGILSESVERKMGLRHRAALGISEASDAVALVVSEETGLVSIAHGGRMIRRLDGERLQSLLEAFYLPPPTKRRRGAWLRRFLRLPGPASPSTKEETS